jgi:hypothetical protein
MGLLADIFSYGDTQKRRLRGLLDDPVGTLGLGATRTVEDQDSLLNLFANAYPIAGDKTVLNTPEQRKQMQAEAAGKALETYGGLLGATVWHGSPHKFNKFDSSKIGTGEGAQAYGHGLYLADSPEVAASYLTSNNKLSGGDYALRNHAGDIKAAKSALHKQYQVKRIQEFEGRKNAPEMAAMFGDARASTMDALKDLRKTSIYKVDLPDEQIAKMLDYDKPLSQQSHAINPFIDAQKASLESIPSSFGPTAIPREVAADIVKNKTGAQAYDLLKQQYGAAKAAEMLRQAGIPGIRYLDGGSRGAGQGSSNYVVFPGGEGLLSILERNGQPIK